MSGLSDDSTIIFNHNLLDHYLDRSNCSFAGEKFLILDDFNDAHLCKQ